MGPQFVSALLYDPDTLFIFSVSYQSAPSKLFDCDRQRKENKEFFYKKKEEEEEKKGFSIAFNWNPCVGIPFFCLPRQQPYFQELT